METKRFWTPEEIEMLEDTTLTAKEIAKKINRTEAAIGVKRHTLGIKVGQHTKVTAPKTKVKSATKSTIGSRIKMLRTSAKLSKDELANKLGYTTKHAGVVISDFEKNTYKPSDEKIQVMATIFNVSPDYILNGDDAKEETVSISEVIKAEKTVEKKKNVKVIPVTPSSDPQPVKTALTNHEGYIDSTAMKAIAKADMEKKVDLVVGGVYIFAGSLKYVILAISGDNVICVPCSRYKDSLIYISTKYQNDTYYINLSDFKTFKKNQFKQRLFTVSDVALDVLKGKLAKTFGCEKTVSEVKEKIVTVEVEKKVEMDDISKIVVDSISYFNEKQGKNLKAPTSKLYLQDAIDISKEFNITLDELVRDHEKDRKLDAIIKKQEEMKKLQDEIDAMQKEIGLSA